MSTKYTYDITSDFEGLYTDLPNIVKLSHEISTATFSAELDSIDIDGDNCDIWFDSSLTTEEQTILDGYIVVHDGYLCVLGAGTTDPQSYFDLDHGFKVGHKYVNNRLVDKNDILKVSEIMEFNSFNKEKT